MVKSKSILFSDVPVLFSYIYQLLRYDDIKSVLSILDDLFKLSIPIRGNHRLDLVLSSAIENKCVAQFVGICADLVAHSETRPLIALTSSFCCDIISACQRESLYAHAFWFLTYMKSKTLAPTAPLFKAMFDSLETNLDLKVDDVLGLYDEAIKQGFSLSIENYVSLLQAMCILKIESARALYLEIEQNYASCISTVIMIELLYTDDSSIAKIIEIYTKTGYISSFNVNSFKHVLHPKKFYEFIKSLVKARNFQLANQFIMDIRKNSDFKVLPEDWNELIGSIEDAGDEFVLLAIRLFVIYYEFFKTSYDDLQLDFIDLTNAKSIIHARLMLYRHMELFYQIKFMKNTDRILIDLCVRLPNEIVLSNGVLSGLALSNALGEALASGRNKGAPFIYMTLPTATDPNGYIRNQSFIAFIHNFKFSMNSRITCFFTVHVTEEYEGGTLIADYLARVPPSPIFDRKPVKSPSGTEKRNSDDFHRVFDRPRIDRYKPNGTDRPASRNSGEFNSLDRSSANQIPVVDRFKGNVEDNEQNRYHGGYGDRRNSNSGRSGRYHH